MGIFDFFKMKKKEDNSELIKLQNIILKTNDTRLIISRKQLSDATNKYVFQHSKIVNDCVNLLGNSNNTDTFFNRFNLLVENLTCLSKIEQYHSFNGILPSIQLNKVLSGKEMMINAFIDKNWGSLLSKIASLKTEKAKQNNIDKFFENMFLYKNSLCNSNIEHLIQLRNTINIDKMKNSNNERIIYNGLKKEIDASLYEYVYNRAISDKTIHKFFPEGIPKQTVFHIVSEYFKGRRSESINSDISKMFFDISNKKLENITRTICGISSTALTKSRSEKAGLMWYTWQTSEDSNVRDSHSNMQDVLINWNNPPSPEELIGEKSIGRYSAGECFECRCFASPIVRLDFISWPHKVYYQNRIQTMTKKDFESIM